MDTIINAIHVIAALSLILTVLLQAGKGAAMGSGLGAGSSQTMFGSSGAGGRWAVRRAGTGTQQMLARPSPSSACWTQTGRRRSRRTAQPGKDIAWRT